jgi:hypothetical protein
MAAGSASTKRPVDEFRDDTVDGRQFLLQYVDVAANTSGLPPAR